MPLYTNGGFILISYHNLARHHYHHEPHIPSHLNRRWPLEWTANEASFDDQKPKSKPLDDRQILDDSKLHVRSLLNETSSDIDNGEEAALHPQVRC